MDGGEVVVTAGEKFGTSQVSEANGLVSLLVDNVAAAKLERAHGWIMAALGDYTATMSLVNGWGIHGWNEVDSFRRWDELAGDG
jgi:hypothetical protein